VQKFPVGLETRSSRLGLDLGVYPSQGTRYFLFCVFAMIRLLFATFNAARSCSIKNALFKVCRPMY